MRITFALVILGLLSQEAAAKPHVPSRCGVSLAMSTRAPRTPFAGQIESIEPDRDASLRKVTIVPESGKNLVMKLWSGRELPFKVGDVVSGEYDCSGGGFHLVCDAVFRDAAKRPLLIISGSGRTTLAEGFTIRVGKIVTSEQDVNQKQKSVRREHALEFTFGKASATPKPDKCARIEDGGSSFLVSGSAISWDGVRPPEGIDYSSFSIVRE